MQGAMRPHVMTLSWHGQALQPRQEGGQSGQTPEEKAKAVLDDLLERLPELFDLEDIRSRIDELTPYIMVAIQVRACTSCHLLCRPECSSRAPG